jgi:hypothetical protein
MPADELLEHLSSPAALRPKDDALLFEETVRRTGGEHTPSARAVRRALEQDADPLRQQHRAEMRQRSARRGASRVMEHGHVCERAIAHDAAVRPSRST